MIIIFHCFRKLKNSKVFMLLVKNNICIYLYILKYDIMKLKIDIIEIGGECDVRKEI